MNTEELKADTFRKRYFTGCEEHLSESFLDWEWLPEERKRYWISCAEMYL